MYKVSFAMALVGLFASTPVRAQSFTENRGVFKAATCNGATSQFVRGQGFDQGHEIGRTKMVAQLVSAGGSQQAGLETVYKYSPPNPSSFSTFVVEFEDDGQARNNVNVHLCFQNGKGAFHAIDKKLTDFQINRFAEPGNWSFATISDTQLGFSNLNKQVLLKAAFSLSQTGNMKFGDTNVSYRKTAVGTLNRIDVSEVAPCNALNNCKDVKESD